MNLLNKKTEPAKAKNPAKVKEAIALGKTLSKTPDITKADVSMKMFELIQDEERDVIANAFVEGAGLTPKGAMTYVYNCRRKLKTKESGSAN